MKKSETRRRAIMDAAAELFQQSGFERTSMADICQRVGYSKATLYNYFQSKDDLFFEVVAEATEAEFLATHDALDASMDDIAMALERFGRQYLAFIYSPQIRAVRRLVIAEAARSDIGKKCYAIGPVRSNAEVAQFLQKAIDAGKLRPADTQVAAAHLKGLLEAEWIDSFMFHIPEEMSPEKVATTVTRAVAAFMAAYGPASP